MSNFPGRIFRHVLLLVALVSPVIAAGASAPQVSLSVDATDAPRKIFHARMTIPAKAGSLTLYYPKWIPGEHGPTGPIQDLAGLKFTAGGKTLTWRRDLLDGWTFHVEVPAGVSSIEAVAGFHLARRVGRHLHRRCHGHGQNGSHQLERCAAVSRRMAFG